MALFGDLPPPASDNTPSLFDDLPPEINSSSKPDDLVSSRVNKRPSAGAEEGDDGCPKKSKLKGTYIRVYVRSCGEPTSDGQGCSCRRASMECSGTHNTRVPPACSGCCMRVVGMGGGLRTLPGIYVLLTSDPL